MIDDARRLEGMRYGLGRHELTPIPLSLPPELSAGFIRSGRYTSSAWQLVADAYHRATSDTPETPPGPPGLSQTHRAGLALDDLMSPKP